jgi:hypothetical protein
MRRQTGHPDTEALANFRAGLVRGIRGGQIAAHIASCERCTLVVDQLSALTRVLASIPEPALPEAVERRIGAALATEAVARQVASLASDSSAAVFLAADAVSPAVRSGANGSQANDAATELIEADTATSDRAGAEGPRFRFRLSPGRLLVPAAACLLFAGLGYLLSVPGAAGMPSSAGPAGTPRTTSAPLPSSKPVMSAGPQRDAISPTTANGSMTGRQSGAIFLVTVSATRYRKSTLGAQVRGQLAGQVPSPVITSPPLITNLSGSQATPASTELVPSHSLVGCVMHLTGDVLPALVQRATYQAEPAYVIAVPDRAWVVGLACTASRPALITSVVFAPVG